MLLLKNSTLNKLLNKSILAFFLKICGAMVGLGVSLFITQTLGAEKAGLYFLALSLMTFPVALCSMGLNNTILKLVAANFVNERWGFINAVVNKSTFWTFLLSLFISSLIFFNASVISTMVFNNLDLEKPLMFIAFSLIFTSLFNLHGHAIQAIRKLKSSMLIMGVAHNLFLLLILLTIPLNTIENSAIAYSVSACLTALLAILLWHKQKKISEKTHVSNALLLSTCVPMLFIQLIAQINAQAGTLMLGYWHEPSSVAFFSVSVKIAALISFILMAVNRVVAPDFSSLYENGEHKKLAETVKYSTILMVFFSLPILLVILLFPGQILAMFGEEFIQAKNILRILAIGQFLYVASGNVNLLLQMTGNARILRNNIFISSLVAVLFGIILIPLYGAIGAAISTAISLTASNILSCYKTFKILKINIIKLW